MIVAKWYSNLIIFSIIMLNGVDYMRKVSIINFSSHENGNGDKIVDYIKKVVQNAEMDVVKFSQEDIHGCGKCQYDCFNEKQKCHYFSDSIAEVYRKIADSDFCYFIVPNYSGVPCSNYFIFRERSQGVWQDNGLWRRYAKTPKHFIVISTTNQSIFKELLKNEIDEGKTITIDFFNSQEVESKSTKGDLITYPYFQKRLKDILIKDGLMVERS